MRDYAKFFTPDHVAKYMAGLLSPKEGDVILEPSAGHGSLVRAVKSAYPSTVVFAIDINEEFKPYMKEAGAYVAATNNFLSIPVHATFNGCIANPPFGNENSIEEHYNHIRKHVKKGGKIVMIVPKDFTPDVDHAAHHLDNWSTNSDGTKTEIKIIEFEN